MTKEEGPALVGVPLSTPVVDKINPGGTLPETRVKVSGPGGK